MQRRNIPARALAGVLGLYACVVQAAKDDIEFVAEHLPEVAMDNRFGTLPVWSGQPDGERPVSFVAQAAFGSTSTGSLEFEGPMLSAAIGRAIGDRWSIAAFVFYDHLHAGGGREERPLQTLFSPSTPIGRPVDALFSDLDGKAVDYGGGLSAGLHVPAGWLGEHRWVGGILWQRVRLSNYRFDYRVETGPSLNVSGQIDFDGTYTHVTPFVGLELPRELGRSWSISPHVLLAVPLPRRGVIGHITGPGFDLHGDTEDVGAGKHFGDPSVTLGLDLTYRPWRLTLDVGTTISQRLLEPVIHDGIDANWVVSAQWRY